jgi:hypothetical protein
MKTNTDGTVTVKLCLDIVALWPDRTTTTFRPKSLDEFRLINDVLEIATAHQKAPLLFDESLLIWDEPLPERRRWWPWSKLTGAARKGPGI